MKLTENQRFYLVLLSKSDMLQNWKGSSARVCNSLVKLGMAVKITGYPAGYLITEAGRQALKGGSE